MIAYGMSLQLIENQNEKSMLFGVLMTNQCPTCLQLLSHLWDAGNVYLFVLSSWKLNIAENPIVVMGL